LFYNGFKRPIEVAVGENKDIMILDEEYFEMYKEISK